MLPSSRHSGFTLIELSVVLVIIGLIIGGVLVGQDLIKAATMRAQVTQIEKYNQAVNTFVVKYNAIPGDMQAMVAAQYGFVSRTGNPARGDGNGLLEGSGPDVAAPCSETVMFWNDLSTAHLIEGHFMGDDNTCPASSASQPVSSIIPPAKLGRGNFIIDYADSGYNYYQIIGGKITLPGDGEILGIGMGITPLEANQLDTKIDDGLPTTGVVISRDLILPLPPGPGAVGTGSAGFCGNTDTSPTSYNTSGLFANTLLCSLSIRFQ